MTIETLYRYKRKSGKITVSPKKPECKFTEVYRLIADDGKILTNGEITTPMIDVDSTDCWVEIDEPKEEPMTE